MVAVLEPERLTPAARTAMAEHQARCPACRNSAAQLQLVQEALSPSPISEKIIHETHANIMAAVRRKQTIRPWHQAVRWAGAVAAMVILGLVIWRIRVGDDSLPPVAINPTPAVSSEAIAKVDAPVAAVPTKDSLTPLPVEVPARSTLALAFDQAADARSAFKLLTNAYEEASNRPEGGDFYEMIALCEELRQKWPDSAESLDAMKLISRCYTQLAEPRKAHETFLAYADEAGEREKARLLASDLTLEAAEARAAERTSGLIVDEACTLFSQKDYIAALTYGDVLQSRYPGTEPAYRAQWMCGEYGFRVEDYAASIAAFREVLDHAPSDSPAAYEAQRGYVVALHNAGRADEAVEFLLAERDKETDTGKRRSLTFRAAQFGIRLGPEQRRASVAMLRDILRTSPPQDHYAVRSRRLLAQLPNEIVRESLTVGDQDILDVVDSGEH